MHMNTNITQVSNITNMKNDMTRLVFLYLHNAVILCLIDDIVDDNIQDEEEVDQGELEDEFDEYNMGAAPQPNPRLVHTVPAKEPDINAVPLKPALKKPKGSHSNHGSSTSSRNSNHNEKNVVEVQITSNR